MKNETSSQFYSVLILMLGLTLSACQKPGQNRHEGPGAAAPAAPNTGAPGSPSPGYPTENGVPELAGTGDVGGGNGINGRVLESYRVDVTKLEAFVKILKPKFDAMNALDKEDSEKSPSGPSAREELNIYNFKTWYMAPIKLKPINNVTLGLSFSQDRTEQLAAQTRREIWINKEQYEKMDIHHQAELIVHEFLMAHYTLRFEPWTEICNMFAIVDSSCSSTHGKSFGAPESFRHLSEDDYVRIRAATAWFLAQDSTLTHEEMGKKLQRLGFDKRFSNKSDEGPKYDESVDRNLSQKEIIERVQQGLQKGLFESSCESNMDQFSDKFGCQFEIDFLKPAKNEKGEEIAKTLSWKLSSEKTIDGILAFEDITNYGSNYYTNSTRINMRSLTGKYFLIQHQILKAGEKYFDLNVIVKKSTPNPGDLRIDILGVMLIEKVYHGEVKYKLNESVSRCDEVSTTLNSKGEDNFILLKAKNAFEPEDVLAFEHLFFEFTCDQQFKGHQRL